MFAPKREDYSIRPHQLATPQENEIRISSGTGSFNPMDSVSKYSYQVKSKPKLNKLKDYENKSDLISEPSFRTESKMHEILVYNKLLMKKVQKLEN